MKKSALILVFVFLAGIAFSQDYSKKPDSKDTTEIKTVFGKKSSFKPHIGYFIGPELAYTQFTGKKDVVLLGLNMGVTINRWFTIGLAGYGIINSGHLRYDSLVYDNNQKIYKDGYLYGGYGGLLVEFTAFPKSPVHVTFPVLIGGGGLTYIYQPDDDWYYNWNDENLDWDAFFVVQPGIRCEINIVKFFRIGVGISYRYTPDLKLINTSSSLINQFNANLSLKFGKF